MFFFELPSHRFEAGSFSRAVELTSISHVTNWTNGGNTDESRTFLMTRTVSGGLYHVNLWEAGSCMVL